MAAKKKTNKASTTQAPAAVAGTAGPAAEGVSSKPSRRTRTAKATTAGTTKAATKSATKAATKTTKAAKTAKAVTKSATKTGTKAVAKAAGAVEKASTKAVKGSRKSANGAVAKKRTSAASKAEAPKAARSRKPATEKRAAAGKATKATKRKVSPVPRGYRTVTPSVALADAAATIAFCKKAFGAKVRSKMPAPGGKLLHAEIEIGDSIVMVSDAIENPACISSLFLYVPNVDKAIAKAVKAGATVTMPAQDMFWGDRFGRVVDPQGNIWIVGARVENVRPEELKKRAKAAAKQMAMAQAS